MRTVVIFDIKSASYHTPRDEAQGGFARQRRECKQCKQYKCCKQCTQCTQFRQCKQRKLTPTDVSTRKHLDDISPKPPHSLGTLSHLPYHTPFVTPPYHTPLALEEIGSQTHTSQECERCLARCTVLQSMCVSYSVQCYSLDTCSSPWDGVSGYCNNLTSLCEG